MITNTEQIESFLDSVSKIIKEYEEKSLQSGEKFNVFDIIGIRNDEVRMHSAMLANLLDAQGSHGMKGKFLELFIKMLEEKDIIWEKSIEPFKNPFKNEFSDTNCISELYAGPKTENEGGRIDLYIYDKNNNAIIIENKINAPEQYKQLIRYNNFNKEAPILFLTLNGDEPNSSIDEITKEDISKSVFCISYKTDILNWLELCHKEASDKPLIREGIKHYINLIKIITNQTMSTIIENEISNLILDNPKNIENYFKFSEIVKNEIIEQKIVEKLIIKNTSNEYKLKFEWYNKKNSKNKHLKFLELNNVSIYFSFENKWENLKIGIYSENPQDNLKNKLKDIKDLSNYNFKDDSWICFIEITEWSESTSWNDLLNNSALNDSINKNLNLLKNILKKIQY